MNQVDDAKAAADPAEPARSDEGARKGEGGQVDWNKPEREDVIGLYRLAFGRKPENEAKIESHLVLAPTLALLRERLFSSPEFLRVNWPVIARETIGRAYRARPENVETNVSPDKLERLARHVEEVWTSLGKIEPHYSVLSTARYKPENIRDNEAEFYASGEAEWRFMQARCAQLGLELNEKGTAIELGCGVGRVSRYIARSFAHFVGYDISAPHLELARDYLSQDGVATDKLELLNSVLGVEFPWHDLFYSRIVLQHNPPPVQKFLLNSVLSRLKLGGVALFQLVTALEGYSFVAEEYFNTMASLDEQELHVLPQKDIFEVVQANGCIVVDLVRDTSVTGFDRVSSLFTIRKCKA